MHLERVVDGPWCANGPAPGSTGSTVDTWVIDRRVVLTYRGQGVSTVSDATSTELFAPDLGLPVFQMSRTQLPQPDGTVRTVEASEELLHTHPEAG